MSNWINRIKSHSVFPSLAQAQSALAAASASENHTPDTLMAISRLRSLLDYTDFRLLAIDPLLLAPAMLDNFPNNLNAVTQNLNDFIKDGSIAQLDQANANAEPILTWLTSLPTPAGQDAVKNAVKQLTTFRKDAESALSTINEKVQKLETFVSAVDRDREELSDQIRNVRSDISSATSEMQRQFSESQDRRSTEFAQMYQENDKEARKLLNMEKENFFMLVTELNNAAIAHEQHLDAELTSTKESLAIRSDSIINDFVQRFEDLVLKLDVKRQEADRLVGLIGDRGVIGSYQKAARYFRTLGWIWSGITVAALIALTGVVVLLVIPNATTGTSWENIFSHLPLFIALGALATYAGYEAAKAQRSELENQKLELDLAALRPFLAGLDDVQLNDFRIKIADRVFGHPFNPQSVSASPATITGALARSTGADKIVLQITEQLIKAAKTGT